MILFTSNVNAAVDLYAVLQNDGLTLPKLRLELECNIELRERKIPTSCYRGLKADRHSTLDLEVLDQVCASIVESWREPSDIPDGVGRHLSLRCRSLILEKLADIRYASAAVHAESAFALRTMERELLSGERGDSKNNVVQTKARSKAKLSTRQTLL